MTVNFSTTARTGYVPTVRVSDSVKQQEKARESINADVLDIKGNNQKEEKKSLFSALSTVIGDIKKTFATAGEYSKGIFNGIKDSIIGGSIVYTASSILKKGSKNTAGVVASIITAVGLFAFNMYKAYLNTNERTADIDHRYR